LTVNGFSLASLLAMDKTAVRVSVLLEFTTGSKVMTKFSNSLAASSVTEMGVENV
jgi:hypothetical protein